MLPLSFGRYFMNLECLNLERNNIVYLPESLLECTKLKCLKVGRNKLKSLPDHVGILNSIEYLDVSENNTIVIP